MRINKLIFDDRNRKQIARHGVEELDVRSACGNRNIVRRARGARLLLLGEIQPMARILAVVLEPVEEPGAYRVITAHYASQRERMLFFEEINNHAPSQERNS